MFKIKRALKNLLLRLKYGSTESQVIYKILYDEVHDLDQARQIRGTRTSDAFKKQWEQHPEGEYLLSDPWFREHVDKILCRQELLLPPEWFAGKKVLDAGCGNGRWSYGFSKLGADLTCVDINGNALEKTQAAISAFSNPQRFIQSPLEELRLEGYDLVFCWGVAHHCESFNRALDGITRAVREGGVLYMYLYGRESFSWEEELHLFRERLVYNTMYNDEEKMRFLLKKAHGDKNIVHNIHDIYAPLINRRFLYDDVCAMLSQRGFSQFLRTIQHTEVFIRAVKGSADLSGVTLPPKQAPYWFQGKHA